MAETLALAVGVPAALAATWWASRRSWSPANADNRGIALQTVIVIVVMLVIAGGVAGVLLSRGGEVITDLEGQDIRNTEINSAEECGNAGRTLGGPDAGAATAGAPSVTTEQEAYWVAGTSTCTINGYQNDNAAYPQFTAASCQALFGGTYAAGTAANAETCTI